VDDPGLAKGLLSARKVFLFAESLGGVESLVTYPAIQTHADLNQTLRDSLGINDRLLRLSVGVENVEDLIDDLATTLEQK